MISLIGCCFLLFISLIPSFISHVSISIFVSLSPILILSHFAMFLLHLLSLSHLSIIPELQILILFFSHSTQSSVFTLFLSFNFLSLSIIGCPALFASSSFYYSLSSQQHFSIHFSTHHVLTLIPQTVYLFILLLHQ